MKHFIGAFTLALVALLAPCVAGAASQFPAPTFGQSLAGMITGGASLASVRCNLDADNVTCHLVVDLGATVTGNGFTRSPAASVTAGTAGTICSAACTLAGISVSWGTTSTAGVCWLTIYNATAPTVGTAFVEAYAFSTATAGGSFAAPIPGTIGEKYSTAVTFAVTTTPNGSTACNTTANSLFVQGAFI